MFQFVLLARASQKAYQKAHDIAEINELRQQNAQLQKQNRLRAAQMEQLNQRLAEYVERHGAFPSSSGSGADGDS